MYSTNLQVSSAGNVALFSGTECVGTAYGWETGDIGSDSSQTAKDNALLWSLSPRMVELLQVACETGDVGFAWHDACETLLDKLAHAIPPASVAADA